MSIEKDLLNIVKGAAKRDAGTQPYDTVAKVVRIEKDTAWVHIDGGVSETPVKLTISAKVGDSVQVRVSGGSAWITGNTSAPPTDDAVALVADAKATGAKESADTAMVTAAEAESAATTAKAHAVEAKSIADNTAQYFWFTSEGTDTGAHITEVPREDFEADPANGGGNLLARSNGIAVRDGLVEEATFGNGESQIGRSGQSRAYINYHSLQLIDKEGTTYFHASDLRDSSGLADIHESVVVSSSDTEISTSLQAYPTNSVTVTLDNVELSDSDYTVTETIGFIGVENRIQLNVSLSSGMHIIGLTYQTKAVHAKAYTFGNRNTINGLGAYSVSEGYSTESNGICTHAEGMLSLASGRAAHAEGDSNARGHFSHAEGLGSYADGYASHAEGALTKASGVHSHAQNQGCVANGNSQTALGQFNSDDTTSAVIVGNGTSDTARSNAATLDWSGNLVVAGDVTNGTGQKLSDLGGASMFDVSSVTTENISLSANTAYSGTITATKDGYYPIAIVGWATNYVSGQVTARSMHTLFLSSQSVGSATITYGIRNNYSASNNGSHTFYILWVKE